MTREVPGGFSHSVAIVTGGTGGLGRAVTQALLAAKAAGVIATYRSLQEFEDLARTLTTGRERLEDRPVDVTDEAATLGLVADVAARHGRIDILVNTVGGYAGGTALWKASPDVMDRMLSLNLRSGRSLCRAVIPVMLRQGYGSIVNVLAKAAALAMMDSLAADLLGTGIRANSILPSIIDTDPNRRATPSADFSKWPKPDDIARVVLFLYSQEAGVVHVASIPVYGNR